MPLSVAPAPAQSASIAGTTPQPRATIPPSNWMQHYTQMAQWIYELRRRCRCVGVLGISRLAPRHAIPPEQLEVLKELQAQAGTDDSPLPSTLVLWWRWGWCVLRALRKTVGIIVLKWRFGGQMRRALRDPAAILLKTWVLDPERARRGQDFYFGTLARSLERRGISCMTLCGDGHGRGEPAFARTLLGTSATRLVPEQLVMPWWAPLVTAGRQLAASFAVRRLAHATTDPRQARFYAKVCLDSLEPPTAYHLLYVEIMRHAVRRWRPKAVLTLYEGQPWELPAWSGAKAADPRCVVVGYQHSIVMPYACLLVAPQTDARRRLAPDVVLCLGDATRRLLEDGHRPCGTRLVSFGSFRRDGSTSGLRPPVPARRTVLVIPEGHMTETHALFSFALRLAAQRPDHRFIFRSHPVLPFERVRPHLSDAPERHANVEVSSDPEIANDYARASAVLYRGSSAVLYAVLQGLKPVYVHDARYHDIDPLYELSRWREWVATPEEATETLARYADTAADEAIPAWRAAADYVNRYSMAVDDASIDRLLDAIGLEAGRTAP